MSKMVPRRRARWLIPLAVALAAAPTARMGGPGGAPALAAPPAAILPEMVTPGTVAAIEKGLRYLARTQRPDGSWLGSGSYAGYSAVMTSLAGVALLSSGSTPETGPYFRQVRKAMLYVLRLAEAGDDGLIVGPGGVGRSMYGHGFSMLFLAQCYGMDLNPDFGKRIRSALHNAVALTARAQSDLGARHKHAGGWYYTPYSDSDEGSVTVTQLQALRACRNAGIKVPRSTIDRAVEYLKFCQQPDGGRTGGADKEAEMVERLVQYVKRAVRVDSSGGHYFYSHFYMAQVMYQRGGQDWREYYPQISNRLVGMQNPDGSWMGDGVSTTYGTAIATTILQLPYGYLPICQR